MNCYTLIYLFWAHWLRHCSIIPISALFVVTEKMLLLGSIRKTGHHFCFASQRKFLLSCLESKPSDRLTQTTEKWAHHNMNRLTRLMFHLSPRRNVAENMLNWLAVERLNLNQTREKNLSENLCMQTRRQVLIRTTTWFTPWTDTSAVSYPSFPWANIALLSLPTLNKIHNC